MNRDSVKYSGHTYTAEGVLGRGRTQLRFRWEHLAMATTILRADRRGWQTIMVFSVGGQLKVNGVKNFSWGSAIGRYAEALALACAHAPESAEIDEATRELARWGSRAMRQRTSGRHAALADADSLVERAWNQRAWLEPKRARKTVTQALGRNPGHPEGLRLQVMLLDESGAALPKILAAADRWAEACPQDRRARDIRLVAGLKADVPGIAEEARGLLEHEPDQPRLASELAGYHFRQGRFSEARDVWVRLADTCASEDVKRTASLNADYLRRYEAETGFRLRERGKRALFMAAAWAPIVLLLAVYGWRTYLSWQPDPPGPDPRLEAIRSEARRQKAVENDRTRSAEGVIAGTGIELRNLAAAGDPAAQFTLASQLLADPRDAEKIAGGLAYLEASAAQNHRWALLSLGEHLATGKIIEKDAARAVALYEQAAALGLPEAARRAAECYKEGRGVRMDTPKAFALYERAAEGGDIEGMTWAGFMLERRMGTNPDLERAMGYYRKAAEANNLWAMERLTDILISPKSGFENRPEAMEWMHRGAEAGSRILRTYSARALMSAPELSEEELNKVLGWLEEQGKDGDAYAAYTRARFSWSATGMDMDVAEALRWNELAAERDYAPALLVKARCKIFALGMARDHAGARAIQERLSSMKRTGDMVALLEKELTAAGRDLPALTAHRDVGKEMEYRAKPVYPARWRQAGVEGEARIQFVIDHNGFTRDVKVISATEPEFGAAAYLSVSCWRLMPAVKDGKRVSSLMQVPIMFTLNDEPVTAETDEVQ